MSEQNNQVATQDANLVRRVKELERQLSVANASPQGYPVEHFNLYVDGQPIASPNSMEETLMMVAATRLNYWQTGKGFPKIRVTKRIVRHPFNNASVTEEEIVLSVASAGGEREVA